MEDLITSLEEISGQLDAQYVSLSIRTKKGRLVTLGIQDLAEDEEAPEEAEEKPKKPRKGGKRSGPIYWKEPEKKKLDDGKMKALRDAGWTYKNIAGEMGCSQATVIAHLQAMGYTKEEGKGDEGDA